MPKVSTTDLTKEEKQTIAHALYMFRSVVRAEDQLAREEDTPKARRDSERFGEIITRTFAIEDKLKIADRGARPPRRTKSGGIA